MRLLILSFFAALLGYSLLFDRGEVQPTDDLQESSASSVRFTPIDKDTPMIESISFPSFKLSTLPTIEFKFNKQLEEKPLTIEFFDAINKTSNYTFNSFPYKSLDKQTIVLEFNKY